MNRIVNAIQVNEKNIADIFKLPCVYQIYKNKTSALPEVWLYLQSLSIYREILSRNCRPFSCPHSFIAYHGDWLCQLSDGKWLIFTDKEYQTIKQNNYVLH